MYVMRQSLIWNVHKGGLTLAFRGRRQNTLPMFSPERLLYEGPCSFVIRPCLKENGRGLCWGKVKYATSVWGPCLVLASLSIQSCQTLGVEASSVTEEAHVPYSVRKGEAVMSILWNATSVGGQICLASRFKRL